MGIYNLPTRNHWFLFCVAQGSSRTGARSSNEWLLPGFSEVFLLLDFLERTVCSSGCLR
jgi:hypothetical protein